MKKGTRLKFGFIMYKHMVVKLLIRVLFLNGCFSLILLVAREILFLLCGVLRGYYSCLWSFNIIVLGFILFQMPVLFSSLNRCSFWYFLIVLFRNLLQKCAWLCSPTREMILFYLLNGILLRYYFYFAAISDKILSYRIWVI